MLSDVNLKTDGDWTRHSSSDPRLFLFSFLYHRDQWVCLHTNPRNPRGKNPQWPSKNNHNFTSSVNLTVARHSLSFCRYAGWVMKKIHFASIIKSETSSGVFFAVAIGPKSAWRTNRQASDDVYCSLGNDWRARANVQWKGAMESWGGQVAFRKRLKMIEVS